MLPMYIIIILSLNQSRLVCHLAIYAHFKMGHVSIRHLYVYCRPIYAQIYRWV